MPCIVPADLRRDIARWSHRGGQWRAIRRPTPRFEACGTWGESALGVACRVYRPLGAQVSEIFNASLVREIRAVAGADMRWRWCQLHRTDRYCQNSKRRSRHLVETEQLCDHGFSGGPGKAIASV